MKSSAPIARKATSSIRITVPIEGDAHVVALPDDFQLIEAPGAVLDLDPVRAIAEVGDPVGAIRSAEHEPVGTLASGEPVVALIALQHVPAGLPARGCRCRRCRAACRCRGRPTAGRRRHGRSDGRCRRSRSVGRPAPSRGGRRCRKRRVGRRPPGRRRPSRTWCRARYRSRPTTPRRGGRRTPSRSCLSRLRPDRRSRRDSRSRSDRADDQRVVVGLGDLVRSRMQDPACRR